MEILTASYITICLGTLLYQLTKKKEETIIQSVENLSKGTMRVGIQGSGKTMAAVLDAIELLNSGYKFAWITTQGERQCNLIDYIPVEYKKDIELFAPYLPQSKGFNWLKLYTNKEQELILKANTTVTLMENISDRMSDNMRFGIRMATLSVLQYGTLHNQQVTLYDTWMFSLREDYREHILNKINNTQIQDQIKSIKDDTWDAINRKFGFLLSNSMIINALCYTKDDALDFLDIMNKIFICDFIEDNLKGLGSIQSIVLSQAIVIQFELLASTRNNDSPYYSIICDEFYRYAEGIRDIFRSFPDRHRQRRIGLYLIWQRMSQMDNELVDIALSCVNKHFMTMEVDDDSKLSNKEKYKAYKGKFSALKEREYISFINSGTQTIIQEGRTKDLPHKNYTTYSYVIEMCKSKIKGNFKWWYTSQSKEENTVSIEKHSKNKK
jgi:hypothetical protein